DPMNYRTGEDIDIIDSHYWAYSKSNVFWANEHVVLFTGYESGRYVHYEPGDPNKPNLYLMLWDMQQEKVYRPNIRKNFRAISCWTDEYYVVSAGSNRRGSEGAYLMKLVQQGEDYQLIEVGEYSSDEIATYPAACL